MQAEDLPAAIAIHRSYTSAHQAFIDETCPRKRGRTRLYRETCQRLCLTLKLASEQTIALLGLSEVRGKPSLECVGRRHGADKERTRV